MLIALCLMWAADEVLGAFKEKRLHFGDTISSHERAAEESVQSNESIIDTH